MHIAKHLQSRAKTIQTAIIRFNKAAKVLGQFTLAAKDVLSKTFVAEFDLLHDARQDIRNKPWAQPAMRLYIDKYFRLTHAKEEVKRVVIEV